VPVAETVTNALARMMAAHAALPRPPEAGRAIAMPRK
jgi:hypothetical protein